MTASSIRTGSRELVSFDGGVRIQCAVARPDRYRALTSTELRGPRISRGAGLSYCAASFGAGVVSLDHRRFNRVLEFDPKNCLVVVEAGIALGELFNFLAPRGFYLSSQPGHPSITVGGCIAADVHGKNQFRDGNFSRQVAQLTLFHPRHGVTALSDASEPRLFALTCGGYGLTGSILSATLRVKPIPAQAIALAATAIEDFTALPALLRKAARNSDVVYSWHDLSVSAAFGRGVLVHGGFVEDAAALPSGACDGPAGKTRNRSLTAERRGRWHPSLLNRATVPVANFLLHRLQSARPRREATLYRLLFPLAGAESRYFDLYGRRGFHEYQILMPDGPFEEFVRELQKRVRTDRVPVSLASAKFFGGTQNLLRFEGEGVCFAIDLPRTTASIPFMAWLDDVVTNLGGVPNIIKDSRLPEPVARRAFAGFDRFRDELLAFDPERLYRSNLSQRLGL